MSTNHNEANSAKAVLYALGANGGIAASKFGAWAFTGSGSMLAEAIHSLADCTNQILLLLGMKRSKKDATEEHPMGFGKEMFFASFLVALLLFSVGGAFSIYEGIHKLMHPEALENGWIALVVLGLGVALESVSLWGVLREIRKEAPNMSLWAYYKESRSSELVVVLGEDIAALFGLAFAFAAVSITMLTGNPMYDAIGSIGVGVLLVAVAIILGTKIHGLLIGQSADRATRDSIHQLLNSHKEIEQVYAMLTIQHGDDVMVSVKAKFNNADVITANQASNLINVIEAEIKAKHPDVRWVFFEIDNKN